MVTEVERKKRQIEEEATAAAFVEKDLRLARSLNNDTKKTQKEQKDALKRIRQQKSAANSQPYMDRVGESAKDLTNRKMENIVEWSTGAMEIFTAFRLLNKALLKKVEDNHPVVFLIETVFDVSKSLTLNALDKANIYTPRPEQKITYHVEINQDGKLEAEFRKDGFPLSDEQKQIMSNKNDGIIIKWLATRGYVRGKDDRFIHKDTQTVLNQQLFQNLLIDDEKGLNAYFHKALNVDIEAAQSMDYESPAP